MIPCLWCREKIQRPPKGEPRLCAKCRADPKRVKLKKGGKSAKKPWHDAMWHRLPGSFESGKRR